MASCCAVNRGRPAFERLRLLVGALAVYFFPNLFGSNWLLFGRKMLSPLSMLERSADTSPPLASRAGSSGSDRSRRARREIRFPSDASTDGPYLAAFQRAIRCRRCSPKTARERFGGTAAILVGFGRRRGGVGGDRGRLAAWTIGSRGSRLVCPQRHPGRLGRAGPLEALGRDEGRTDLAAIRDDGRRLGRGRGLVRTRSIADGSVAVPASDAADAVACRLEFLQPVSTAHRIWRPISSISG